MGNRITFSDLPENIDLWEALPLSLNGIEVVPLDYNAGKTGWIMYGKNFNKSVLAQFQQQLSMSIVIVSSWKIGAYQVVRFAGSEPKRAQKIAHSLCLDVASIDKIPNLLLPGLLVIDLESVPMTIEFIEHLACKQADQDKIKNLLELAFNGELEWLSALKKAVQQLKGSALSDLESIKSRLKITKGFSRLVHELHKKEWKIMLISSGLNEIFTYLEEKLQLDGVYANQLSVDLEGKLTGKLSGEWMDAKYKVKCFQEIMKERQISAEQSVVIGDVMSDLGMMKQANLGIAYHATSKLNKKAPMMMAHADLMGVFCILSASLDNPV